MMNTSFYNETLNSPPRSVVKTLVPQFGELSLVWKRSLWG